METRFLQQTNPMTTRRFPRFHPVLTALLPLLFLMPLRGYCGPEVSGKEKAEEAARPVTLAQFIHEVIASNLDLAAQRYSVPIAKANLIAARVSPNPTLSFGYNRPDPSKLQSAYGNVSLSETIEMGGKRSARVTVAEKNVLAASAALEDFIRTLRGTAAGAYIDATAGQMIVEQKERAFQALNGLAGLNEFRLSQGDLAEVDYNQARSVALQAKDDLKAAEITEGSNLFALVQLLGKLTEPKPKPASKLEIPQRAFSLEALRVDVLANRPDVVAAREAFHSAEGSVRLARANRYSDVTVSVTGQQNSTSRSPIDPAPNYNSILFGVSAPLPIFNSYRGEYLAAVQTALQAKKTFESTQLKAETDLRTNYERFELAKQRAAQYEGHGVVELADKVLGARLLAYKQGSATLLDVLQAQKDDTDTRLAWIDALTERGKALVALEQAAGIWDIEF